MTEIGTQEDLEAFYREYRSPMLRPQRQQVGVSLLHLGKIPGQLLRRFPPNRLLVKRSRSRLAEPKGPAEQEAKE